jgi:hypothetical protein
MGGSGKRSLRSLPMGVCVAGILPAIRGRDALDTTIGKPFGLAAATHPCNNLWDRLSSFPEGHLTQ